MVKIEVFVISKFFLVVASGFIIIFYTHYEKYGWVMLRAEHYFLVFVSSLGLPS